MDEITITHNGQRMVVALGDYVQAKVGDLRQFGFPTVTAAEIEEQLDLLLAGKSWTNIIGSFIEDDEPQAA